MGLTGRCGSHALLGQTAKSPPSGALLAPQKSTNFQIMANGRQARILGLVQGRPLDTTHDNFPFEAERPQTKNFSRDVPPRKDHAVYEEARLVLCHLQWFPFPSYVPWAERDGYFSVWGLSVSWREQKESCLVITRHMSWAHICCFVPSGDFLVMLYHLFPFYLSYLLNTCL